MQNSVDLLPPAPPLPPVQPKKKRGRRPKGEIKEIDSSQPALIPSFEQDIVIAILLTEQQINDIENADNQPQIDYKEKYHKYKATAMLWKKRCKELEDKLLNHSAASSEPLNKITELLYLKEHYDRIDEIKESKELVCHWCCHSFDTPVCVVPERFINGKFEVFGYMCSFNCSLSYILAMQDERTFERIALLQQLYKKVTGRSDSIKPAPQRQTLKIFGGCLDIAKFRSSFSRPEEEITYYLSNIAPLIPLVEVKYNATYTPTDMLKRTKPRPNHHSFIEPE